MSRGHRARHTTGRAPRAGALRLWAPSLAWAAALGLLLATASTSLPYLLAFPTTDPHFGPLNHCLATALPGPRLGWAVSQDGQRAAAYESHRVALCSSNGSAQVLHAPGATAAAFDGQGQLWVAAGGRLWLAQATHLAPMGDLAPTPVALAGLAAGVLALDAEGQLLSVSPGGQVQARASLPAPGPLWVGPAGDLAVVLLGGGLVAFDPRSLTLVRAETPCPIQALWWLHAPHQVLLACGPQQALSLNLLTGERQPSPPPRTSPAARRLGSLPLYVQDCEGLPCSAPPP